MFFLKTNIHVFVVDILKIKKVAQELQYSTVKYSNFFKIIYYKYFTVSKMI